MQTSNQNPQFVDVLVIGTGISGIGAAYYLKTKQPKKSFMLLEAREALGGTWDLFRYPGIRSDSDLHTFGYAFKPWTNKKSIANAKDILAYLQETAKENQIDAKIKFQHKVTSADWNSTEQIWHVSIRRLDTDEQIEICCKWLLGATGYYRYDEGFTPKFQGRENFKGTIIHPQHWPENLDYSGKRVVVIGSGATAVTLLPAMAKTAAHITMLQRTPTYILPVPAEDKVANLLRKVLPDQQAYSITRQKNIMFQRGIWEFCQRFPNASKQMIKKINAKQLPKDYPIDKHFNPPYNPWDQRLCAVPNGDLYKAIRNGDASIVTDQIEKFTENGILLKSGQMLEADIIITATGLNLQVLGGIKMSKDGQAFDITKSVAYKGMMLSDLPNFCFFIGYTNSSWTLKIGLLCEQFCKLLTYMDEKHYEVCYPIAPKDQITRPLLDFDAGYVKRAIHLLPKQGSKAPWLTSMSYSNDLKLSKFSSIADENLQFS